jgi:choline monooxygenase
MLENALASIELASSASLATILEEQRSLSQLKAIAALPNEAYTSSGFLDLERTLIFARTWVCVAIASDLPRPGDMVPVDVAGQPIVLVRDRQGILRAFHNICSHRGLHLVTKPCNNPSRIHCPYHAWTYDLEGKLRKTPNFGGYGQETYEGFDRDAKSLKLIRVDQWLDFIFVNLSGDALPLVDYLAPVIQRWTHYDFSQLRYGDELGFQIQANWKLAVENFSESYHLPTAHPQLNNCSRMEDHYGFDVGESHVGQGSSLYKCGSVNGTALPTFANLSQAQMTTAEYVALFPNLMVGVHPDYFIGLMVNPIAPDRSKERLAFYFVGDDALAPEFEQVRDLAINLWKITNEEDIEIVERMQIGRMSLVFDGGCFSPALETTVQHFQRLITQWMNPTPPTIQSATT